MQSIWNKTTQVSQRKELREDIVAQNVVIGAGMAGFRRAKGYAEANEAAIQTYEEIIREEGILCQFERLPSFLYSLKEEGKDQLRNEAEAAKKLGIDACFIDKDEIQELPFEVSGAVCFSNQAQFHPLEFIKALSEELTIYESTNVLSVHGHVIITDKGNIIAENIIFATHYPFLNVPGFYFIRQHQERSYVLALEGKEVPDKLSGIYYGIDKGGLSLRSAEGKLLLGGGSHRTGKKVCH